MKTVTHHLLPLLPLVALAACGKAKDMPKFGSEAAAPPAREVATLPVDGSNISGLYQGEFITVNTDTNGFLTTSALISRSAGTFYVSLKHINTAKGTWHKQDITDGQRCPTKEDDKNEDGHVDAEEGKKAWGETFIPLDADLSSKAAGENSYPIGDDKGTYTYRRSTEFEAMFTDLALEEGTELAGKLIVIYGADIGVDLPETVAELPGLDRHQSYPIACGLITKMSDGPGKIENDAGKLGQPSEARPEPRELPEVSEEGGTLPGPPTLPEDRNPEVTPERPRENDDDDDDDSEDWDDNFRRWWRRTWSGRRG